MVARGEIGFLISSTAKSNHVFDSVADSGATEIFLIVTWAIVICTIVGPLCVGLLVRRVRRLNGKAGPSALNRGEATNKNVLGDWGVEN